MDTIQFTETDAPKVSVGRAAGPNPFDGHFPTKVIDGTVKALQVSFPGVRDEKDEEIRTLVNAARRAADKLETPMTARVNITTNGKGKTGETIVTFWTVEKIVRKRADTTTTATE